MNPSNRADSHSKHSSSVLSPEPKRRKVGNGDNKNVMVSEKTSLSVIRIHGTHIMSHLIFKDLLSYSATCKTARRVAFRTFVSRNYLLPFEKLDMTYLFNAHKGYDHTDPLSISSMPISLTFEVHLHLKSNVRDLIVNKMSDSVYFVDFRKMTLRNFMFRNNSIQKLIERKAFFPNAQMRYYHPSLKEYCIDEVAQYMNDEGLKCAYSVFNGAKELYFGNDQEITGEHFSGFRLPGVRMCVICDVSTLQEAGFVNVLNALPNISTLRVYGGNDFSVDAEYLYPMLYSLKSLTVGETFFRDIEATKRFLRLCPMLERLFIKDKTETLPLLTGEEFADVSSIYHLKQIGGITATEKGIETINRVCKEMPDIVEP